MIHKHKRFATKSLHQVFTNLKREKYKHLITFDYYILPLYIRKQKCSAIELSTCITVRSSEQKSTLAALCRLIHLKTFHHSLSCLVRGRGSGCADAGGKLGSLSVGGVENTVGSPLSALRAAISLQDSIEALTSA